VTADQRAQAANTANAIYFLSFHAADLGTASPRIAVFTLQPPPAATPAGDASAGDPAPSVFILWDAVQQTRLDQSLQLAAALQQQFARIGGMTADPPSPAPVRTLRSVNAPAVAIEVGRLAPDINAGQIADPSFQQQVASAIARALEAFEKGAAGP
jgi:N-acetylmuramoyl-L-alanine amidase